MKSNSKYIISVIITFALLIGLSLVALAAPSSAASGDTCEPKNSAPGYSGKIDVGEGVKSVTVTAPAGSLIVKYCVKAGSARQGLGPVYVNVDPPQGSVTITYPDGKDISHYSYWWEEVITTTSTSTSTSTTSTTTTSTTSTTTPSTSTSSSTSTVPSTSTSIPRVSTTTTVAPAPAAPPAVNNVSGEAKISTTG